MNMYFPANWSENTIIYYHEFAPVHNPTFDKMLKQKGEEKMHI